MARFADKLKKKTCSLQSLFDFVIVGKELMISTTPNAPLHVFNISSYMKTTDESNVGT